MTCPEANRRARFYAVLQDARESGDAERIKIAQRNYDLAWADDEVGHAPGCDCEPCE